MRSFTLALALLLSVGGAAAGDPVQPTLPIQYQVANVTSIVRTNAGFPPYLDEEIAVQYFDYVKQKERIDVATCTYGDPGPYTKIYDYSTLYPNDCEGMYPDMEAPRGYQIEPDGTCCYANLIEDCPAPLPTSDPPYAETMAEPALPQKNFAFLSTTTDSPLLPGSLVDWWEQNLYAPNTTQVFLTQDFYFDGSDHQTQRANYFHISTGPQYINITTIYNGEWTVGPQDDSVFDISSYDCSQMCKSSVGQQLRATNPRTDWAAKLAKHTAKQHQ